MQKLVAGVDIGGTNTAYALLDMEGNILGQGSFPTPSRNQTAYPSFEAYIQLLAKGIQNLASTVLQPFDLVGIGVGAPNANYYSGCIEEAANLPWRGRLALAQQLSQAFPQPVPTYITNDANAAAIGEMIYGGAKGMKNFVVITLGTGVGSGFVVNGDLMYGHDGFAGEFGHIIVHRPGRECGCGRSGCLETYTSANGMVRTALELLSQSNKPSVLREMPMNSITSKALNDAARQGDPIAIEAFKATGKCLGQALADLVAITTPEAIFLFGGLVKAGELIMEPTRQAMEENLLSFWKSKVKLLPSALDEGNAAILGASALAWKEIQN